MHIDVDVQDSYHTFTIDSREGHFPQPQEMFKGLRQKGVKCSTNITPFVSSRPREMSEEYKTYVEGIAKGYFVQDDRDIDPSAPDPHNVRYMVYDNPGNMDVFDPNVARTDYAPQDDYQLAQVFNSKQPFHGGVFYGNKRGSPGVYPNVNNPEVRRWWGDQYKYLFEQGLEFVWQDMTQPCMAKEYGDMKS
jgi:alpha-glucosidase (family GH31 glycosyl hydrolase)